MNWFQIVFLREQSQDYKDKEDVLISCELISNCIFTWAITSQRVKLIRGLWLWIDFKLYFYVSNHKHLCGVDLGSLVVNWFQIVFLREQSQVAITFAPPKLCCELISNCIFTWAITRTYLLFHLQFLLWIDFKLYFYVSNHK